jgi:hypothetical protein
MDSLEIRFSHVPGTANYGYTNATVTLFTVRAPSDTESYVLTAGSGFFSTRFRRSVSGAPVPGNGTLEHAAINDTIVAVFRNSEDPFLPLDTLRLPIPITIRNLRVVVNDDTLRAGDTLPIPAFVISGQSDTIRDRSILDHITWSKAGRPAHPRQRGGFGQLHGHGRLARRAGGCDAFPAEQRHFRD